MNALYQCGHALGCAHCGAVAGAIGHATTASALEKSYIHDMCEECRMSRWNGQALMTPSVVAVVGATGTGKSALASAIAKDQGGYTLSADARQVYRDVSIGTNKEPATCSVAGCADTHGLDWADITQSVSVHDFLLRATHTMHAFHHVNRPAIIVGGTAQWVTSLLDGLRLPTIPAQNSVRAKLMGIYKTDGIESLRKEVQQLDPWIYARVDSTNPRRLIRAIEIARTHQATLRQPLYEPPLLPVLWIGMQPSPDTHASLIRRRVWQMIETGWLDEVRHVIQNSAVDIYKLNKPSSMPLVDGENFDAAVQRMRVLLPDAFRSIGYPECAVYVTCEPSISTAYLVERITRQTLRYVRRQYMWWKRHPRVKWVSSVSEGRAIAASYMRMWRRHE